MRYYAPFKADGVNLNTLRTHDALPATPSRWSGAFARCSTSPRCCSTGTTWTPRPTPSSIFWRSAWSAASTRTTCSADGPFQVQSFADLEEFFRAIFDFMEVLGKGGEVWKTHHIATIRKIRNRLGNICTRSKGLVTDDGAANDLPWGDFADRSVHVVDVAGLDPLAQDLVFARIVSKLREHLERRDLGVDHVVVFVDELNKYAPADGPDTYVRKMLLDLSERGRYLGLVLFSAQQFRSQVQRRVVGQCRHGRLRPHGHG